MIEVVPMTSADIDGVLKVEEECFAIAWTRADFEREMNENKLAVYFVAEEREMIGITLEVKISNYPAQKLYSNYGFKPEGFRKNYYKDTNEDAIVMWKYFENYENYEKK